MTVLWRTLTIYNGMAFEKTELIFTNAQCSFDFKWMPHLKKKKEKIKKEEEEAQPLASSVFLQFTKRTHRLPRGTREYKFVIRKKWQFKDLPSHSNWAIRTSGTLRVWKVKYYRRVGGLKTDCTRRGIDVRCVAIGHDAVTFMDSTKDVEFGPDTPLDCV